jgi:ParB family chromosome partitioning protein
MGSNNEEKVSVNAFAAFLGAGDNEEISQIELSELHPFKDHPFKVIDDDKMMEMAEGLKNGGKIIIPGIVRPLLDGGYEIISGHRRKRACELAGLDTMPVIIRNMNDDEAVLEMVKTNLDQREELFPSEKAFAYKMKLEALSHQGKRDEGGTSDQVGRKLETADIVGESGGDSKNQVRRYIRLTRLIKPLLDLADEKKIKFIPAVELSYLTVKQQEILLSVMTEESVVPSLSQAQQLKKLSQDKKYTKESVHDIMVVAPVKERKVTIKPDIISKYFDPDTSEEDIEEIICGLLDDWKQRGGQRR